MSGASGTRLDGGARRGPVAGRVFPCRLHAASRDCPDRLLEQAGRLWAIVQIFGANGDDHRRRSQAHGCAGRHDQHVAHLGIGADAPPACPHDRSRWRLVAGREPVDRLQPRPGWIAPSVTGQTARVHSTSIPPRLWCNQRPDRSPDTLSAAARTNCRPKRPRTFSIACSKTPAASSFRGLSTQAATAKWSPVRRGPHRKTFRKAVCCISSQGLLCGKIGRWIAQVSCPLCIFCDDALHVFCADKAVRQVRPHSPPQRRI